MSSTLATAAASFTNGPDPTNSPPPSGGGNTGPQNSPLLFFVALGFGVVFTNLWIIVGVKYCFRYNARNRARQQGEDGEPIDLAAMPPRRRRREKKLMTMDEVNERFPILKYKTWVSTRAAQGLSTEGGVSQSRAASIKEAEGVIAPIETHEAESSKKSVEVSEPTAREIPDADAPTPAAEPSMFATASASLPVVNKVTSHAESADVEDDDEAIPAAVPGATEMLTAPGDSCAICIDTLEDDDDVRGLSCGHAFHASCLDPWLTSRRACCPLCKADYYVPKPRPDGTNPADPSQPGATPADGTAANPFDNVNGGIQRPPLAASTPAGGISRYIPRLGRSVQSQGERPSASRQSEDPRQMTSFADLFSRRPRNQNQSASVRPTPELATSTEVQPERRRWMPSMSRSRRGADQTPTATPGQLEAGSTRPT